MDLKDALMSIAGKSPLADLIIQNRFGDMISESASTPSEELTDDQRETILEAVVSSTYSVKGDKAVRELSSVILNLLDQLAMAHEAAVEARDEDGLDDDETTSQKMELFRASIKGARIGDLKCYYTEQMFKTMQHQTRKAVASELVNHATANDKEPAHIWSLLAQNNGQM